MLVRCFGGSRDPYCYAGRFGYEVPVRVRLGTPVSTKRGKAFTELRASRAGARGELVCLPPAFAC